MSRSRKKNVVYKDYRRNWTSFAKRQASKAVRRYKGDIPNGKSYRKIYNSWDIFDWRIFWSKHEIGTEIGIEQDWYNKLKRK